MKRFTAILLMLLQLFFASFSFAASVSSSSVGDTLYKDNGFFSSFTPVEILAIYTSSKEFRVNDNGTEKIYKDSALYTYDEKSSKESERKAMAVLGVIGAIVIGGKVLHNGKH